MKKTERAALIREYIKKYYGDEGSEGVVYRLKKLGVNITKERIRQVASDIKVRKRDPQQAEKVKKAIIEHYGNLGPQAVVNLLIKEGIRVGVHHIEKVASDLGVYRRDPAEAELVRKAVSEIYPEMGAAATVKHLKDKHGINISMDRIYGLASQSGIKFRKNDGKSTATNLYPDVPQEIKEIGLKIKTIIDEGPVTVAALSSRLNVSKETIIKGLDFLRRVYKEEEGCILTVSEKIRGKVEKVIPKPLEPVEEFPGFDTTFRFLVIGHTLLGQKFQQLTHLYTIMKKAEEMGVKLAVVVGGALAGKPGKGTYGEFFLHEPEEQAEYLHRVWPRCEYKTYFLAGDEELSWGTNLAEYFCSLPDRDDLRYLGAWSANIPISGTDTTLQLVYPRGGVKRTYTIGYRPQKAARALLMAAFSRIRSGSGFKDVPKIIFNGRVLAQGEINSGTKTVLCPGLTDQTPSLAAAEVIPSVGAMIVEFKFSKDGRLLPDFDAQGNPQEGGCTINYYDLSPYIIKNDYGEFPECPNCTPHEQRMLAILKEQASTVGEISRRLNCSTGTVENLLRTLQEKGLDVKLSVSAKRVIWTPEIKESFTPLEINLQDALVFGTTSDVHLGSKHQQLTGLKMIHRYAKEVWKAKVMLNAGDNFDGRYVYRGQDAEVFAPTFDEQLDLAVREWPQEPVTIAIGGNHDESFWKAITADMARHLKLEKWPGLTEYADIMRQFSKMRPEIRYLGESKTGQYCTEARAAINAEGIIIQVSGERGLLCYFLHPHGGAGQFRTYKSQKFIENFLEGILSSIFANANSAQELPHIYLMGNWHVNAYLRYGGVDIYLLPSLQGQTRYMKERGLSPSIGSWMVKTAVDERGHILRNTVKYLDLIPYAKEKDY